MLQARLAGVEGIAILQDAQQHLGQRQRHAVGMLLLDGDPVVVLAA